MSVLASSRQRYPLRRYVNVAVRRNPKAQDCVTKTIRDPFTTQFTPVPRGKIAYLAASFRHINACARGEIPIVAAPPPFPTRDFLPWRFSAAGRRSAWRDRHPGSRKPTQHRPPAPAFHTAVARASISVVVNITKLVGNFYGAPHFKEFTKSAGSRRRALLRWVQNRLEASVQDPWTS